MINYQKLITSALQGDKNAFAELYRRFYNMALSVAYRQLGDQAMAEDAVQEAFVKAYLALQDLENLNAFPNWLRKIVRTCCRQVRKQHGFNLLSQHIESEEIIDQKPGPYELTARYQTWTTISKTLDSLNGVYREACIQRFILGRTYREISDILGVPEGTIKRRLHDAKEKIIRDLDNQGRPVIRVGFLPVSDHLLAMVAHHLHDQQKFEIYNKKHLSWSGLVDSLKTGALDAAFIMAPLALSLRNQGMPILYVLDGHHNGSAITVRQGNAAAKSRNEWGCVGFPYHISTQSLIFSKMFDNSAKSSSIRPTAKYISPSYLIKSLMSGKIDAFFCAEPWNTKAALDGTGRIIVRSREIYPEHICCILVVKEDFAIKKSDILKDYIKLLATANELINTNPDYCARIQAGCTGVPAGVVEMILKKKDITYQDIIPDKSRVESFMNLAVNTGLLQKSCNLNSFMRTDLV